MWIPTKSSIAQWCQGAMVPWYLLVLTRGRETMRTVECIVHHQDDLWPPINKDMKTMWLALCRSQAQLVCASSSCMCHKSGRIII